MTLQMNSHNGLQLKFVSDNMGQFEKNVQKVLRGSRKGKAIR